MEWMELLAQLAKKDEWYQECLARMKKKEGEYLEAVKALAPQQHQLIEDYIAACEELEHALLPIAYRLGAVTEKSE